MDASHGHPIVVFLWSIKEWINAAFWAFFIYFVLKKTDVLSGNAVEMIYEGTQDDPAAAFSRMLLLFIKRALVFAIILVACIIVFRLLFPGSVMSKE